MSCGCRWLAAKGVSPCSSRRRAGARRRGNPRQPPVAPVVDRTGVLSVPSAACRSPGLGRNPCPVGSRLAGRTLFEPKLVQLPRPKSWRPLGSKPHRVVTETEALMTVAVQTEVLLAVSLRPKPLQRAAPTEVFAAIPTVPKLRRRGTLPFPWVPLTQASWFPISVPVGASFPVRSFRDLLLHGGAPRGPIKYGRPRCAVNSESWFVFAQ